MGPTAIACSRSRRACPRSAPPSTPRSGSWARSRSCCRPPGRASSRSSAPSFSLPTPRRRSAPAAPKRSGPAHTPSSPCTAAAGSEPTARLATSLRSTCSGRRGATAASVLLGVDGTLHGERRRARFFARNAHVPLMLIAIGPADVLVGAVAQLRELIVDAIVTLERVETVRSSGAGLAMPPRVPERDPSGLADLAAGDDPGRGARLASAVGPSISSSCIGSTRPAPPASPCSGRSAGSTASTRRSPTVSLACAGACRCS